MPLVRAIVQGSFMGSRKTLGIALSEVVPAAFCSGEGQLTPGSIEYISSQADACDILTADVFIEVEAYFYEDRYENLQQRCEEIKRALRAIFPGQTFAIWGKLVAAGWSSDSTDPEFDGDMSMDAAISRAVNSIAEYQAANFIV